jgi:3-deoxy-D-manno-octulosonic-acid transferase
MPGCIRRTVVKDKGLPERSKATRRFLLDTIGELRQAYALADIVVVGRSFGDLFGSDVTEPIGLGKATIIGPAVSDFVDMVTVLLKGRGLIQVPASELALQIKKLLDDPAYATEIGKRGRAVIRSRQGAALRHARLLQALVDGRDLHNMSTKEVAALIQDESDDGEERAM